MNLLECRQSIPKSSTVAVVGAGPVGLETAAWGVAQGLDVVVFEKHSVGHHIKDWGHVKLFSSFGMNHSKWSAQLLAKVPQLELPPESSYLTGLEYIKHYLEPLAKFHELSKVIFTGIEVKQIGKVKLAKKDLTGEARSNYPFRLLLKDRQGEFFHHARAVIDASGVYSSPQFMGNGNIPAIGELRAKKEAPAHLQYNIPDLLEKKREHFTGRNILLVGGGHSTTTCLEYIDILQSKHIQTKVYWSNKKYNQKPFSVFENDPLPYRDKLNKLGNRLATSPPAWLEYFGGTNVEEIKVWPDATHDRFEVKIRGISGMWKLKVDKIIANVGFSPNNSLYRQLQVHECYATSGPINLAASLLGASADCLFQESQGIEILKNPEPYFFILGNKSYGSNSNFLLKQGIEQVNTVMNYLKNNLAGKGPTI